VTDAPAVAPTPSPARLVTGPFVSLAVAALAFYVAGGILLPVTPRFVEDRLGGGSLEVGIVFASYAVASVLASGRNSKGMVRARAAASTAIPFGKGTK